MEGDTSRFESVRVEAVRQLRAEAGIAGVTLSATVPLEERFADIEVEGGEARRRVTRRDSTRLTIGSSRFFGARLLAGRRFEARSHFGPARTPVDHSSTGRSSRKSSAPRLRKAPARQAQMGWAVASATATRHRRGTWRPRPVHTRLSASSRISRGDNDGPMMFHPLTTSMQAVTVTIRAASGVGLPAGRLRAVTGRLDPQLRVGQLRLLEDVYWQRRSPDQDVWPRCWGR